MEFLQAENQMRALILPFLKQIDQKISEKYPEIHRNLLENEGVDFSQYKSYFLTLDCQLPNVYKGISIENKRYIMLTVALKQMDRNALSRLNALVMDTIEDVEDVVLKRAFEEDMPATEATIRNLFDRLPVLYHALESTLAGI